MIRKFKSSDFDIIMSVWLDENIKAHNFISPEYWQNNYYYVKSVLPNAEIYVYADDENVTGFIGLNCGYIEGVFVRSLNQHKGAGTALINAAKKKYDELTLKVYCKNTKAIAFYTKNGFEITEKGVDKSTGEEEYTMMWKKEI